MTSYQVRTASGSLYRLREDDDGRFWMAADNVVTPFSRALHDGEWEIRQPSPWPPQLGQSLFLVSVYVNDKQHPLRVPGGGKRTTRVTEIIGMDSPQL